MERAAAQILRDKGIHLSVEQRAEIERYARENGWTVQRLSNIKAAEVCKPLTFATRVQPGFFFRGAGSRKGLVVAVYTCDEDGVRDVAVLWDDGSVEKRHRADLEWVW